MNKPYSPHSVPVIGLRQSLRAWAWGLVLAGLMPLAVQAQSATPAKTRPAKVSTQTGPLFADSAVAMDWADQAAQRLQIDRV